ncbi:translation elongation factor Ts [Pseudemcibacter aquimaris]|uniref:translation elongation factor Ts n=1 Tax=Pseudemcibacter aquimaris TaxID=2857064 RepID=UPI002010E801|nr:translation elongation factor Ts [Pseudemcibacter aquimaris]MCC3860882.1 translation elongation factor Ts [Pseudemcibacter aquimaris]WDU59700.1 translation elongation factor Ts [Pseudemcibacter aquimaris]
MAQITAALVKELRDKSGAGMMDCKKALGENDGDIEAAMDWLRQKGIAKAEKKSGRVAAEGLVAVASNGTTGVAVEVNSETDFVARNEQFQTLVKGVAGVALENGGDFDATNAAEYPGTSHSVEAEVTEAVGTIGENMTFRRSAGLTVSSGVVSTYIHNAAAPGLGKLAVLVALESDADAATLDALGKQLAMHVAATNPASMTVEELDPAAVEREKAVLVEQARESGKPDNIIEKMIVGRMNKYYQEVVFVEQTFVIDGETKIKKVIENAAKDAGTDIKLAGYVRLEVGDGIEKEEDDFAAEVAAMQG